MGPTYAVKTIYQLMMTKALEQRTENFMLGKKSYARTLCAKTASSRGEFISRSNELNLTSPFWHTTQHFTLSHRWLVLFVGFYPTGLAYPLYIYLGTCRLLPTLGLYSFFPPPPQQPPNAPTPQSLPLSPLLFPRHLKPASVTFRMRRSMVPM